MGSFIRWTAEMDAAVRDFYKNPRTGPAEWTAKRLGVDRRTMMRRAELLGVYSRKIFRFKSDYMTNPEIIKIVNDHLGAHRSVIQKRLEKAGYMIPIGKVSYMLHYIRHGAQVQSRRQFWEDKDRWVVSDIAQMMGVHHPRVNSWIKSGMLKASATSGQMIVSRRALRSFLINYPAHWDHRIANKWALIDLLANEK